MGIFDKIFRRKEKTAEEIAEERKTYDEEVEQEAIELLERLDHMRDSNSEKISKIESQALSVLSWTEWKDLTQIATLYKLKYPAEFEKKFKFDNAKLRVKLMLVLDNMKEPEEEIWAMIRYRHPLIKVELRRLPKEDPKYKSGGKRFYYLKIRDPGMKVTSTQISDLRNNGLNPAY